MQIGSRPAKRDIDAIPADLQILHVQRLVDIAEEVHNPLQRLLALGARDVCRGHARRVVCDGGHDAAFLGAVAGVVDVARGRGVVERIDVVQGRGECAVGRIAVGIGPGGDGGEVGRGRVVEEGLREGGGRVGDEVLRYEGDGVVAEGAPGGDAVEGGERREEERRCGRHGGLWLRTRREESPGERSDRQGILRNIYWSQGPWIRIGVPRREGFSDVAVAIAVLVATARSTRSTERRSGLTGLGRRDTGYWGLGRADRNVGGVIGGSG